MTHYISTRKEDINKNTYEAILEGISKDGGLYVMKEINKIVDINTLRDLSYQDLALKVISNVFDDLDKDELKQCIDMAYDRKFDDEQITPLKKKGDYYFLELFHGPTCAFKDIALTFLPRIMVKANEKIGDGKKIAIVTATSGDTGKAALEGFKDVEGTLIKVLYPYGMVSYVQERQMTTSEGKNVEVLALNGNFDDCQRLAKKVLTSKSYNVHLSSANSINIGRLIPQVVYYFKAYFALLNNEEIKENEKIDFVVPTGNFGDILAGYIAKQMDLNIDKLICASNENDVLTDFINTGIYDANRPLYNTMSPSIDILISSNLERLLYFICKDTSKVNEYMNDLNDYKLFKVNDDILRIVKDNFIGLSANQSEVKEAIKKCYQDNNYLLDTHTAVAYACANKYQGSNKKVILSTASPFKFAKDVYYCLTNEEIADDLDAMDKLANLCNMNIPKSLKELKNKEVRFNEVINKDDNELLLRKLEANV